MRYRIKPWRGISSGRMYFDIQTAGFLLWRKVVTCFSKDEAERMLADLRKWDVPADGALRSDEERG
jgi:hypothetical protein